MIKLLICTISGIVNNLLSLWLIYFLLKNRNNFPYTNVSSKWVIILLTCVMTHQTVCLINYYFKEYGYEYSYILLKTANNYLIHYTTSFPLIVRAYLLAESIKYSFYHLTQKVYDEKFQKKANEIFKMQYYSEDKDNYLQRIVVCPLLLIYSSFLFLISFQSTRCFLFYYTTYGYDVPAECGELRTYLFIAVAESFELFMFFGEMVIFVTLIFNVMKYPIKSDPFNIRTEIFINCLIWVLYHNLYHGFQLFFIDSELFVFFMINVFQNFSFNALYIYLIRTRRKINKDTFLKIIHNYDLFMNNHLCFSFFKEYMKIYHEDASNYLAFWVDYYLYKQQITNFNIENEKEVNILYKMLKHIYNDYFNNGDSFNFNVNNTNSFFSISANSSFYIDFPVDIQEYVEDAAQKSFNINVEDLETLFDEAFLYVNNKLYNFYVLMNQNEEEYIKIKKLISFVDFDEIKTANI